MTTEVDIPSASRGDCATTHLKRERDKRSWACAPACIRSSSIKGEAQVKVAEVSSLFHEILAADAPMRAAETRGPVVCHDHDCVFCVCSLDCFARAGCRLFKGGASKHVRIKVVAAMPLGPALQPLTQLCTEVSKGTPRIEGPTLVPAPSLCRGNAARYDSTEHHALSFLTSGWQQHTFEKGLAPTMERGRPSTCLQFHARWASPSASICAMTDRPGPVLGSSLQGNSSRFDVRQFHAS